MAKFIVDLWLDGYEDEAEMEKACEEFIYEQLNFTASSVKIEKLIERPIKPSPLTEDDLKLLEEPTPAEDRDD